MATGIVGNQDAFEIGEASSYSRYKADTTHEFKPGVMILPVASEAGRAVVVQMHGPISQRIVTFDVAKEGNPPVVPAPSTQWGDEYLSVASVTIPTPIPNMTNSGYNWAVKGQYIYVKTGAGLQPGVNDLSTVGYPYLNPAQDGLAQQSIGSMSLSSFKRTLIDSSAINTGQYIWPLTVYPSDMLMNPLTRGA